MPPFPFCLLASQTKEESTADSKDEESDGSASPKHQENGDDSPRTKKHATRTGGAGGRK